MMQVALRYHGSQAEQELWHGLDVQRPQRKWKWRPLSLIVRQHAAAQWVPVRVMDSRASRVTARRRRVKGGTGAASLAVLAVPRGSTGWQKGRG